VVGAEQSEGGGRGGQCVFSDKDQGVPPWLVAPPGGVPKSAVTSHDHGHFFYPALRTLPLAIRCTSESRHHCRGYPDASEGRSRE
jgi:hypothetical protein